MKYAVDQWTERGVRPFIANTKREANVLAEFLRQDRLTIQTVVTFPSGSVRVCPNPKRAQK